MLTSNSNFDLRSGSVNAILAGDVGIDKTTSGIVTLSKANTFTGVTTVSAGQLDITADGALGTTDGHTIVHAAGLLDFQLADYTTPEPIRMNDGVLQNDFAGTNSFAGPGTLLATSLIDPGSSGSFAECWRRQSMERPDQSGIGEYDSPGCSVVDPCRSDQQQQLPAPVTTW